MRATVASVVGLCVVLGMATAAVGADRDLRLVEAAAGQDRQAVRDLLTQGVDVNAARADGATALLWAAHWDDLATVDLLLGARANANAADDYGVTALARACENASESMVDSLLAAGANPNMAQHSGMTPLMIASRTGSVNVVKALLAHGANVNGMTTDGSVTALMWAVSEGHQDIVRVLIEGGADVEVSTTKGFTPLMFAARSGDIDLAKVLIAAGADVNKPGADGTEVLPYAILVGHDQFALFLLEQGADPNGTVDGVPALHAAAGSVSTWLANWARRRGENIAFGYIYQGKGLDPSRRMPVVKALLAAGANPNSRITDTAMFMGYIGYPKKGAFEPFATGTGSLRGATPLWVAAYTANGNLRRAGDNVLEQDLDRIDRVEASTEVLKALLAAGGDPHLTTDDGTTPLMVAAGIGRSTFSPGLQRGRRSPSAEEAVTLLLEAGADLHAINEADFTALHGAAFRGLNEVIQILVDRGADINARDFKGRTPYRIAEGAKQSFQFQAYPETAAFLAGLGADTRLGVPGSVQERARDLIADAAGNQN